MECCYFITDWLVLQGCLHNSRFGDSESLSRCVPLSRTGKKRDRNVSGAFSHTSRTPTSKHLSFPSYLSYDPVTLQAIISGNWGKGKLFIGKVTLRWEPLRLLCPRWRFFRLKTETDCLLYEPPLAAIILVLFLRLASSCFTNMYQPPLILTPRLPGSR